MIGWFIGLAGIFLCAGIGLKWIVDRVLGQQVYVVMTGQHAAPGRPEARRVLEFDDTMDVLGSGIDVGIRMGRHARPGPGAEPGADGTWEPRRELVLPATGGWLSGPCLDPLPDEQLAPGGGA